jgi:hypothetical protein
MMFPSHEDLGYLRKKLKEGQFQWKALTADERRRYHAYDYGFIRVYQGTRHASYPLDLDGVWFSSALADQAERYYRNFREAQLASRGATNDRKVRNCWQVGYFGRYDEPWFRALPVETQRHFKEQDLARADAFKTAAPEELAKLCVAQAEENFEMFKRNQKAMRPPMSSAERDAYIAGRRPIAGQRELSRDEADAALGNLRQSFGLPE